MNKSEQKIPRDPQPGTLKHWREALPEERMAHLVKDAARGFSRSLQARLREHSVLYGHWTFLRILWQTDGLTQRQLSEQAGVAEPTTFSALKTMENLGYLTRQKLPDNRKQVRVFLTPKGVALRTVLVPFAIDVNRIALAGITQEDISATRRTLLAMIENLAADDIVAAKNGRDASANGELSEDSL
jgi:MarR family transcriptional regulator, organic hydroperoxide resistance regulator